MYTLPAPRKPPLLPLPLAHIPQVKRPRDGRQTSKSTRQTIIHPILLQHALQFLRLLQLMQRSGAQRSGVARHDAGLEVVVDVNHSSVVRGLRYGGCCYCERGKENGRMVVFVCRTAVWELTAGDVGGLLIGGEGSVDRKCGRQNGLWVSGELKGDLGLSWRVAEIPSTKGKQGCNLGTLSPTFSKLSSPACLSLRLLLHLMWDCPCHPLRMLKILGDPPWICRRVSVVVM